MARHRPGAFQAVASAARADSPFALLPLAQSRDPNDGSGPMKMLRLELDELLVESFTVDAEDAERGTVEAQSLPTRPLCTANCGTGNYCNTATCTVDVCC